MPFLESVLPSNVEHLNRGIDSVLNLPAQRIGVIGLAFKEDTDDLRESPVVSMLEHLIGKGRDLRVFDPHIKLEEIYGANRSFILESIPHISRLMVPDVAQLLAWADYLVVAQKQRPDVDAAIQRTGLPVLDLTRCVQKTPVLAMS